VHVISYSTHKRFNAGSVSGTGIVIGDRPAVTDAVPVQAPPSAHLVG
jgi:hypothetical protein